MNEDMPKEEFTELLPSTGQINNNAYVYRIKTVNEEFYLTVISPNATTARAALQQQFGAAVIAYIGVCERIMQVNG